MKLKMFLIALFVALVAVTPTFAQQTATGVKVTWQQAAADIPYVKEWKVYEGDAPDPATLLATLQNTGAPLTTNVPINVTGTPGSKVKKYYAVSAVGLNGSETAKVAGATSGGVAFLEFTIPYPNITAPQSVTFEIIYQ